MLLNPPNPPFLFWVRPSTATQAGEDAKPMGALNSGGFAEFRAAAYPAEIPSLAPNDRQTIRGWKYPAPSKTSSQAAQNPAFQSPEGIVWPRPRSRCKS